MESRKLDNIVNNKKELTYTELTELLKKCEIDFHQEKKICSKNRSYCYSGSYASMNDFERTVSY